ncbi:amidohydrolase [Devosia sp. LjRoot3]|uniref:amidohydrolase n=1 Tax=Devosia sp. LjRoot3 TaxID=3342319 RepID=UPI003ED043BC
MTTAPQATRSAPIGGPADLILRGGPVITLDAANTVAEALAIRGGEIIAVGGTADISALKGPMTQVIELDGRAVLPGINDAHLHGSWLGARWPSLFFGGGDSGHDGRLLDSAEARRAALRKTWALLAAHGITSYTEPGIGPGEDQGETGCFGTAMLDTYVELAGTEAQTARVTMLRLFGFLDGASTFADMRAGLAVPAPSTDPRWLAIPGVKIFADGIPPMHSAWTRTPYPKGGYGGLMTGTGNEAERLAEFTAMVEMAHGMDLQIGVHATGDRTIEEFVGIIERLGGAGARRHYLIHVDLVSGEQLRRMTAAGIGLALQPLIADHTAGWLAGAVSPETAASAWPIHLMLEDGLRAVLSSDAPIASFDWRRIIASAAGLLEQRGVAVGPAQLTRLLRMYTSIPAEQDGAEHWKGTLEPGKVGDLCVLSADPHAVGAANLPELTVELTIVDGRVVFDRSNAPAESVIA